MASSLVISLDFELMWGVRDHRTVEDYGDAILGARQAIPLILQRFAKEEINATWATVGLLFARNKDEMIDYAPVLKPNYHNKKLSPYGSIYSGIGKNEYDDPLHFGRSLIERIAVTPGQEIGTHTYSHYYTQEPGSALETFESDLSAAKNIAHDAGFAMRSIVFPRNQMSHDHILCCEKVGLDCFRGNPNSFPYRPRSGKENTLPIRAIRLIDSIVPLCDNALHHMPVSNHKEYDTFLDVPASRFLRPWNRRFTLYSFLHIQRIKSEMKQAAKHGRMYHLWWHPHNMGRNIDQNMYQLDDLISYFRILRDQYGMQSRCMGDFVTY